MLLRLITGLIAIVMLSLSACKDDSDGIPPEVVFLSPPEHYNLQVPDTVLVQAEVTDDQVIESVSLSMVDENYIPRVNGGTFYPGESRYRLSVHLPVTGKSLPGGRYYLLVTATDRQNMQKEYLEITLGELPREVTGYIAVTASLGFKATVTSLGTAFENDTGFVVPHGYALGGTHGPWELFLFVTPEPSTAKAMRLPGFVPAWEYAGQPPQAFFTDLLADHQILLSGGNGDIVVLDESGDVTLNTPFLMDRSITHLAADETYLFASAFSLETLDNELMVFYRATGSLKYRAQYPGTIRDIIALSGDLIVVSQVNDEAQVYRFDPDTQMLTLLKSLPGKEVHAAIGLSGPEVLLLAGAGTLAFDTSSGLVNPFVDGYFKNGRYDDLGHMVFLWDENRVEARRATDGALVREMIFEEEVQDFHIVYNK